MNCSDIEQAIEALFVETTTPYKFQKVDVSKDVMALSRPGITVSVVSGNYEEQGMTASLTEKANIVVLLVVKNVSKESERRKVMHPLTEYVTCTLNGQALGLEIEPLQVKEWKETTTEAQLSVGLMTVEITFETSFEVVPDAEKHDYRLLESIWSTYFNGEDTLMESKVEDLNNNGEA